MQAVRDSYADISLMRERGLSWAEISDLLAKLGVTARDNQPISPVTLRSAFFLVGNEGGPTEGNGGQGAASDGETTGTASDETLDAIHRAALQAGLPRTEGEKTTAEANAAPVAETGTASAPDAAAAAVSDPEVTAAEVPATGIEARQAQADENQAEAVTESDAGTLPEVAPHAASEGGEPASEPVAVAVPSPMAEAAPEPAVAPAAAEPAGKAVTIASEPRPVPSPTISSISDDTTNRTLKGDRMLGTIFVLNDRGGVGKTLLSHHLMATAMIEGLQLKVVEYEVNERLARLFGTEMVEHRRITQDFMNMMGSGDGFYEFWDMIGPELQRGGRLFDFGGNISQWFFNWAEVSGFDYYVGEGERLTFMVPVTVDLASLSTGMTTLERIATIAPKAKRVLVENGNAGPFSQLEDSQYAKRKAEMMEKEGLQVISMPPCSAPAWARLTGHRLDQVAAMTREDLVKLGMTPPVASRSLIVIHEWLRGMRQSLSPYLHDALRQTPGTSGAKSGARQGAI